VLKVETQVTMRSLTRLTLKQLTDKVKLIKLNTQCNF